MSQSNFRRSPIRKKTAATPSIGQAPAPVSTSEESIAVSLTVSHAPVDEIASTILAPTPESKLTFLDSERAEIARRVAEFKALQERIKREREEYFEATRARVRELP